MTSIVVIINPISGGGRGTKAWNILMPGLHALFDKVTFRISNQLDDIARLTANLMEEHPDYCLIIGGDGTLSHALNGLMKEDKLKYPKTHYAYFNTGCGGDFARLFGPQKVMEFLNRLSHHATIETNIGKITFANSSVRYFINIASAGISAHVVSNSEQSQWLKKLGGSVNYFLNALKGLISYQSVPVIIQLDEKTTLESNLFLIAICNGQFFGGRMQVAPLAEINDDLLDVIILQDLPRLKALFKLRKIYTGDHLLEKNVHYVQAKKINLSTPSSNHLLIEADGELIGLLPASFELLETKLQLIV